MPHAGTDPRVSRPGRALRSAAFLTSFVCYLCVVIGLGQRLVLWPAIWLFSRRRRSLVGAWLRIHSRATFRIARYVANVRLTVAGAIAPESCVVVMNHQSVLDIPLALMLVSGPYPLIITRSRYRYGIPGISPIGRIARFPFINQKRILSRAELATLVDAADQVARGEQSLLIFPEGHRTRDGNIGRFMRNGLRIILRRAKRPVYCIVVDGMSAARTFADSVLNLADTDARVTILGPFSPPSDDASIDSFIDSLRERMVTALAQLRSPSNGPPARAADPPLVR